jgi:hypothetical protein
MTPSHASASRKGGGEALTGGVQSGLLSSEITHSGCRPRCLTGKAARDVALSQGTHPDPRSRRTRACTQAQCTETGRSGDRPSAIHGRSGRGRPRPSSRHARFPEVGRRRSIDEANEQGCTTGQMWPTTGGVRGEKAFGQGKPWADDCDRHTGADGSSGDTLLNSITV